MYSPPSNHNYPLIAHTVQTSSDVAATFHLEPSHNPKAGDKSIAWFALTKAGGEIIPLGDCDCQLALLQSGTPIAAVAMKSIDAEQYKDIPGGEVVFPKVGIYILELVGKPKVGEAFKPFKLSYQVTVQPGSPEPMVAATTQIPTPSPIAPIGLIGGAIAVVILAGLIFVKVKPTRS
jgi:hypothetical protein